MCVLRRSIRWSSACKCCNLVHQRHEARLKHFYVIKFVRAWASHSLHRPIRQGELLFLSHHKQGQRNYGVEVQKSKSVWPRIYWQKWGPESTWAVSHNDNNRFLGPQQKKNRNQQEKWEGSKIGDKVYLLQMAGPRRLLVKILSGTDRQMQPYKTFSTTTWLRGDVLAASLTKYSSLHNQNLSCSTHYGAFEVCWWQRGCCGIRRPTLAPPSKCRSLLVTAVTWATPIAALTSLAFMVTFDVFKIWSLEEWINRTWKRPFPWLWAW